MDNKMFAKILDVLDKDYDHETPDVPRSKDFIREYGKVIKKLVEPYGLEVSKLGKGAYCECWGYLKDKNDKFVYFNSGDFRYNGRNIFDHILIRTAKSETDYTGGMNHYCKLEDIGSEAKHLMDLSRDRGR